MGLRFFRLTLGFPVTCAVVLFAMSNRQDVPLRLWPFDLDVAFPLYGIVLLSVAVGFAFGVSIAVLSRVRLPTAGHKRHKVEEHNEGREKPVQLPAPPRP